MSEQAMPRLGAILAGRFQVLRLLARGGMGEVYEATDNDAPGERAAIKMLNAELSDDPELRARFEREAVLAAEIDSSHVAAVLGAGTAPDGCLWIAFEFLDGESLDVTLRDGRKLPFDEVAWIVEHMLLGLAAAHDIGVIHRDIKPGNLFLERAVARLRVLDFGVAKKQRTDHAAATSASGLTALDNLLGTPTYMSPEQFIDPKHVDPRTDLYSAGLVTFRMLAGRLPFERRDIATLQEMKKAGAMPSLARISRLSWPDELEGWLQHMTSSSREHRFTSAHAALAAWRFVCRAMDGYEHASLAEDVATDDTELNAHDESANSASLRK